VGHPGREKTEQKKLSNLIVTMNLRDDKYDVSQEITLPLKPNQVDERCRIVE